MLFASFHTDSQLGWLRNLLAETVIVVVVVLSVYLGVLYRIICLSKLLSTYEIIHGEFGAIECLNLKYALTPLPCQSHRDKCFEIHVFFVCHFVL
jgi:hypothetical protein